MTIIYLASAVFVILFIAAMAQFVISAADRRQIVAGALQGTVKQEPPGSRFDRLSRRFNATRFGRYLERDLVLAGITFPPILVFAGLVVATIAIPYLLAQLLAPLFGLVGLVCGYALLRVWLHRARERRKERFVQQIPELARLLSNATNAGLSIATAWVVAEAELAEPAKTEIQRLNAAVRFGASLEDAMVQLNDRLPAREVRVLMSTLVVSARSGGSLVKALRDISLTLDDRKEVRREIRTTLAQARSTSILVTAMGIGMLLMLNVIQPGTVEKMTQNLIGQLALILAFALFAIGYLVVRRITRIER
jgi:tight adherence protein B